MLARLRLALGNRDNWLLPRALIQLGWSALALRVLGFQGALGWAEQGRRQALRPATAADRQQARRYARALERAARWRPSAARCLHRSLALHRWLRREGLASELRIGVRREGGRLTGHAWVELAGEVVNDHADRVAAFTRLTERSARGPDDRPQPDAGREPSEAHRREGSRPP